MEETKMEVKNQHGSDFRSGLDKTRQSQFASDFTLKVGGRCFPVHRNVLVACSGYFDAMLKSDMVEVHQGSIDMKEADLDGVIQCIDFMYTGEAEINLDTVEGILHEATSMQLHGLRKLCSMFLQESLDYSNCIRFKQLAQKYGCENEDKIDEYIIENFELIIDVSVNDLPSIDREDFKRYLGVSRVSDYQRWRAVVTWMKGNQGQSDTHVGTNWDENALRKLITEFIDMNDLPPYLIIGTVLNEPLVNSNPPTRRLAAETLFRNVAGLKQCISDTNCVFLKNLVKDYSPSNITELTNTIDEYIRQNFRTIFNKGYLNQMNLEEIIKYFENPETKFVREKHKVEAALTWIKYDVKQRKKLILKFFKTMNMEQLSKDFLLDVFVFEPIVKNSSGFRDFLLEYTLSGTTQQAATSTRSCGTHIAILDPDTGLIDSFDPETNTITRLTEVYKQDFMKIVSVDGDLFMVRGRKILKFREGKAWLEMAELQDDFDNESQLVSFQNSVYLVGMKEMASFDVMNNSLRENLPGCGLRGKFYVDASRGHIFAFADCEAKKYDPEYKIWEILQAPRINGISEAAIINNDIFLVEYENSSETDALRMASYPDAVIHRYDLEKDTLTKLSNIQRFTRLMSTCVIGNKLYFIGPRSIVLYNVNAYTCTTEIERPLQEPIGRASTCTYVVRSF